ncbi:MAG TPA: transcription termination/antitermination NusG family protein [Bryobacteraceae bacterium]|nr:transcription termination/antitermination NusG family protein [Bryobacteraceae bacterium]
MAAACPEPGAAFWYALQVRHNHERLVSTVLSGQGYREFFPACRGRRRRSDRTVEVEMPLFPGYVFCHFDAHDRRVPIVTTPGVIRIVGIARGPVPVDECEIAAIQKVVASGFAVEPWPYVRTGQNIRIQYGALAGVEGILVDVKNHRRLIVSITLLRRSIHVDIDSALVVPN